MELTHLQPDALGVRDSKNGTCGPILTFSVTEFATLFSKIKEGRLNLRP